MQQPAWWVRARPFLYNFFCVNFSCASVFEHNGFGNREVDDESGHIDQRGHKGRRCTRRFEATSPQDERKHRPRKRAEGHGSLIPSEGYRGAYRLSVRAGNATSIRKRFPLPDETLCSGHLILKDSSAAKLRVPHISLVFCEMWDTTAFDLRVLEPTSRFWSNFVVSHISQKTSEIWGTRSCCADSIADANAVLPCRNAGRLMMKWVDRFT
jgi:hypothetical protein